ncbi:MAG: HlyD family efflux transporter periplasmic adaptor subunit [Alphaproteobacteria bacterium]
MSDLFRKEAVSHAARRLDGSVILTSSVSMRLVILVLSAIVLGGAVFAALATYARREIVTGWVVPDKGLVRAAARQGGLITSIAVHEGDHVDAGARLAELVVSNDLATGNSGLALAEGLAAEGQAQRALAEATSGKLATEAGEAHARLARLKRDAAEGRRQLTLQQERAHLAKTELERAKKIAAKGFLTQRDLDARRGDLLAAEQSASELKQKISTIEQEADRLRTRLTSIPMEIDQVEAQAKVADAAIRQRAADAQARSAYVVTSPIAGRVAALPTQPGQTILPGAAVAVIVPDGSRLEAEVYIPSRAAGFIKAGQEVRLRYHAFPFQRFGTGKGALRELSRTVLAPSEVTIPGIELKEPVFRARIALERDHIAAYGERLPLQPGMLLNADVVIDRRTLIEWLFDPLYAVGRG